MNVKLSERFPERSFDGIKDMRRLPKYTKRVAYFLETEDLPDTLSESRRSPPERGHDGMGEMPTSDVDDGSNEDEGPR